MTPIQNNQFNPSQTTKNQTINAILDKLTAYSNPMDPREFADVLSLKLCNYPEEILSVALRLCNNLNNVKTPSKIKFFITLFNFMNRSKDNTDFVEIAVSTNEIALIDRIWFFIQLCHRERNHSPHAIDQHVIFFTHVFDYTAWSETDYINILKLQLPIPLIKELEQHNLLKKLPSFNAAKFWDGDTFPWTNAQFIEALSQANNSQELYFILEINRPLTPIDIDIIAEDVSKKHSIQDEYFINDYGFGDQNVFNRQVHATILEAVNGIKIDGWSFEKLLVFFGYRRFQIAVDAKTPGTEYYGKISSLIFGTECVGTYALLGERLNRLHIDQYSPNYRLNSAGDGVYYFQGIEVSKVVHKEDCIVFEHSDPDNLPFLLPYIKRAYHNALNQTNPDELIMNLGELFWLFCFSKPFCKGEVTIVEMMMKSILLSKGYPAFSWAPGIIPWCEAVCQPEIGLFVLQFKNMLVFDQ